MTTRVYTHMDCFAHDPGRMHPEHPARLKAVLSALDDPAFQALERVDAPLAEVDRLELAHPRRYVDRVFSRVPSEGLASLDGDTCLSAGSREAALRAAGGVCAAVDAVVAGDCTNAFCAVRPPGHHAEPEEAMGFCLFSNVAIGALHARQRHRLHSIAVVDFDVHHGNGTQAIFWDDPDLFFFSTHQVPLFPGTGSPGETGVADNIVNVPLSPMDGSEAFRAAFTNTVLRRLTECQPELIFISAGFDAHERDPLASLRLHEDDFEWATQQILRVARNTCGGRVVSALEGGYDLEALELSTAAHVRALMNA
jgi:acetoin utilization deacetylase AcuC-like enzyme